MSKRVVIKETMWTKPKSRVKKPLKKTNRLKRQRPPLVNDSSCKKLKDAHA